MKNIILTIFLSIFILSCNSDNDTKIEKTSIEKLTFRTNSSIVNRNSDCDDCSPYSLYIEDGNNTVFLYSKKFANNSDNIESGSTKILRFEIANNINEFSYSDNDLANIKAHYDEISFINIPTTDILKGIISGTKLDNGNWEIKINVEINVKTLDRPIVKNIEGTFMQ